MRMVSPEQLRRFACFAELVEPNLKRLAMISEVRTFSPGEVIFREQQPADHLYLILEGTVDIRTVVDVEDRKTVGTVGEGELMVLSSVLPTRRTRFEGVARETTRAVAMPSERLRDLMAEDPAFGYAIMQAVARSMASRLEGTRYQLAAASHADGVEA